MIKHEYVDLIDNLLGLSPEGSTYAARHFRTKVLMGTQQSYEALFSDKVALSLAYRWVVAFYACQLTQSKELAQYYLTQAQAHQVDANWLQAAANDQLDSIDDELLKTLLVFTRKLTLKPIEGDKEAVALLEQAGIATPDIIAVSQLIAFLSYQVRLVAGLKAMQALES